MTSAAPITNKVTRLRQRRRANGTWRIWWEPEADVKALGFSAVALDANRPTWSKRQCESLNREVDAARTAGGRVAPEGKRTVAGLIHEYKKSRKFLKLRPATHRDYVNAFKAIENKWGSDFVSGFTKPVMFAWYETLYQNSGQNMAIAMLRKMSVLFSHAERIGWRPEGSNPCSKLGMEIPAPRARTYSWAEFDHLIATADKMGHPEIACACGLSMLAGTRQTDVRMARLDGFTDKDMFDPTTGKPTKVLLWEFTRSKRNNNGWVPVHRYIEPRVRNLIDTAQAGCDYLIVTPKTGQPYSQDRFTKTFAQIRAAAAQDMPSLASVQFRDLRRTFGRLAREAGVLKDDIGDVLGNSAAVDPQLGETYMAPTLATTGRAVTAIVRPDPKKGEQI